MVKLSKGFYIKRKIDETPIDEHYIGNVTTGTNLNTLIKNDLLYGVGSRPSLPSCFEDEDELKQDGVDPLSDMRHDSWHDVSVAMNPQFNRTEQTIEVGPQVEIPTIDDPSKDE